MCQNIQLMILTYRLEVIPQHNLNKTSLPCNSSSSQVKVESGGQRSNPQPGQETLKLASEVQSITAPWDRSKVSQAARLQKRSKDASAVTQKSLWQAQFGRRRRTHGPRLGVTNEAVQAALDVGHLLQHVVHAGFVQLQTHELRVLTKNQG